MIVSQTSCFKNIILFIILFKENNAFRSFERDGTETVLALENEEVTFECTNSMPMSYCGFLHPNGTRFSFTGPEVNAGRCQLKLKVTQLDNGIWKCHIGQQTPGLEIVQMKYVLVSSSRLVAVEQNISSAHGEDVNLYCTTAQRMMPLRYCRFEPPSGNPFSIGPGASSKNPILSRYYFPEHRSLDRGDCSVTIRNVQYTDVGKWTCGAGFNDDGMEYSDFIMMKVEGRFSMSTATTTAGLTVAIVMAIIVITVLVIVIWKKRHLLCSGRVQDAQQEIIEIGEMNIHQVPHSSRSVSEEAAVVEPPPSRSVPEMPMVLQPPSSRSDPKLAVDPSSSRSFPNVAVDQPSRRSFPSMTVEPPLSRSFSKVVVEPRLSRSVPKVAAEPPLSRSYYKAAVEPSLSRSYPKVSVEPQQTTTSFSRVSVDQHSSRSFPRVSVDQHSSRSFPRVSVDQQTSRNFPRVSAEPPIPRSYSKKKVAMVVESPSDSDSPDTLL